MDLHYQSLSTPELEESLLSLKMKRSRIGSFASFQVLSAIESSIISIESIIAERKEVTYVNEQLNSREIPKYEDDVIFRDVGEFNNYTLNYDSKSEYPKSVGVKQNSIFNNKTFDTVYEQKAQEYLSILQRGNNQPLDRILPTTEDIQEKIAQLLYMGYPSTHPEIIKLESDIQLKRQSDEILVETNTKSITTPTHKDISLNTNKVGASSHQAVLDIAKRQFKSKKHYPIHSNNNYETVRQRYITKRTSAIINKLELTEAINSQALNDPIRRTILKMAVDDMPLDVYNKDWPLTDLLRGPYWAIPPILQDLKSPRTHVKLLLPSIDYNHQAVGKLIQHLDNEFKHDDVMLENMEIELDEDTLDDEEV